MLLSNPSHVYMYKSCLYLVGGVTRTLAIETDTDYTFELFMCVALLQQCRPALLRCYDPAQVFQCINK